MSLDAIGIPSHNIKKSVEFYKILGIDLQETGSPDHLEGKTPSGVRIMLDSIDLMKKIQPDWKPSATSNVTLGFKQNDSATVNSVFAEIKKAGFSVIKEPWDAFWGQRYCTVQDPDGNPIDIFADL